MAASRNKKVVNIQKYRRSPNIGVIMFVIISVYMIINIVMYYSKERVSIYEVTIQGSITKEEHYTGIIIRDETVYTAAAAGYINYYLREGERAAIGNMIYTLDESGRLAELLSDSSKSLKDTDLTNLKKMLTSYVMSYDPMKFEEVYNFKMDMDYQVLELASMNNIVNLDQILNNSDMGFFQKYTAEQTGIVAYYTDGMEGLTYDTVTAETFDTSLYKKVPTKSSDLINAGSPAYKMVTNDHWSLVFPLTEELLQAYGNKNKMTIRFLKDDFQVTADFSVFSNASGTYGKLDFDRYMIRYLSDRYLTFEIVETVETGLKIPKSAVTEKNFFTIPLDYLAKGDSGTVFYLETYDENGTPVTQNVEARIYQESENFYYVDTSSFQVGDTLIKPESTERYKIGITAPLKGVYSVNQGYTVFRQIETISENEEYYIIKTGTSYGLSLYDHIILNSKTVEENQVIYQ